MVLLGKRRQKSWSRERAGREGGNWKVRAAVNKSLEDRERETESERVGAVLGGVKLKVCSQGIWHQHNRAGSPKRKAIWWHRAGNYNARELSWNTTRLETTYWNRPCPWEYQPGMSHTNTYSSKCFGLKKMKRKEILWTRDKSSQRLRKGTRLSSDLWPQAFMLGAKG